MSNLPDINTTDELVINGRVYPMWSQFVQNKHEWIGGELNDLDMGASMHTEIVDIELRPNGNESAFFQVVGKDFTCGGDVRHLGIVAGEEPWLTLSGYMGHKWRIRKPEGL